MHKVDPNLGDFADVVYNTDNRNSQRHFFLKVLTENKSWPSTGSLETDT